MKMQEKFDLRGMKFNRLTVIESAGKSKDRQLLWKCQCDCGNTVIVAGTYLRTESVKSCGCLKHDNGKIFSKDITGMRSGKLVAIRPTSMRSSGKVLWECKCDCGNIVYVQSTHIINGHSKSCGCYSSEKTTEMNTTHGKTGTRLYRIWTNMKARCCNQNRKCYSYYGGRGITVCDEWLNDFAKFYCWAINNGYSDKLTLDRKNCDKGYSPDNCRWATWHEQRLNQRRTGKVKKGVTKQELVKSLEETLKLTREEVVSLELTSRQEPEDTVIIHFKGGDKPVNISMDSGLAIIRDVSAAITY